MNRKIIYLSVIFFICLVTMFRNNIYSQENLIITEAKVKQNDKGNYKKHLDHYIKLRIRFADIITSTGAESNITGSDTPPTSV